MRTLSDVPIGGATISIEGQRATTDDGGKFMLTFQAPARFPLPARIEAGGHVIRETAFRANNSTLDLISLAAPFNPRFYSDLARGTLDQGGPNPLQRWTTQPAIAISPTTVSGASVDPAVLDLIETAIRDSFTQWTGGRLTFSRIERRAMDEGQGDGALACDPAERRLVTATERHHAAIAYTRQPGNVEPDSDPPPSQPLSETHLEQALPVSSGRPRWN